MNSLDLARWQFGLTTLLHFAVVGVSIGLVFYVAILQTRWHRSGDERWLRLTRYYGQAMLMSFAVGVVTGILQTFQLGMNWSRFSAYVGDVFGAPLALEGLGAFFIEAVFLGLWMFGWGRLPRRLHLACVWIVAGASVLSAYAILVANAWIQHPVGYEVVNGHARLTDIVPVLFNANIGLTVGHVLAGSLTTGSVLVLAIACWQLLRGRSLFAPVAAMALRIGLVAALLAATFGHFQGVLALRQQPMKMAAAEALYETEKPAGLSLFALAGFAANPGDLLVDVKLPAALSVLNDLSISSTVRGIDDLQAEAVASHGPGDYVPIVGLMYWAFRAMVGSGTLLIAVFALGCWLSWRGRLEGSRKYLRVAVAAAALPFVAETGGWILREGGRQPWVVDGLLRTADGVSANVGVWTIALSLAAYLLIYGATFVVAGRTLARELAHDEAPAPTAPVSAGRELALTY